jgi:hypothetical protein
MLLVGCALLASATLLVVWSNFDARMCEDVVVLDYWTTERQQAGCSMYDGLQLSDSGSLIERLVQAHTPLRHLTLVSARMEENIMDGQPLFQPTPGSHSDSRQLQSMRRVFMDFEPDNSSGSVMVDIIIFASFRSFQLDCRLIGYAAQSDWALIGDGEAMILSAPAINSSDPMFNVTIVSTGYNDSTTQELLRRFYAPLPSVVQAGLDDSWEDFRWTRHVMYCKVCVRESAISIFWLILLGIFQAAALINAVLGCAIRKCNSDLHSTGVLVDEPQCSDQPFTTAVDFRVDVRHRQEDAGSLEQSLLT